MDTTGVTTGVGHVGDEDSDVRLQNVGVDSTAVDRAPEPRKSLGQYTAGARRHKANGPDTPSRRRLFQALDDVPAKLARRRVKGSHADFTNREAPTHITESLHHRTA
jgi:hypothetical protein